MRLLFVTLVINLTFFVGCAENLQRDIVLLQSELNRVKSMQSEHVTSITELQTDVDRLRGQIEVLEHNRGAGSSAVAQLEERVSTLLQRVPPPKGVPVYALEEDQGKGLTSGRIALSSAYRNRYNRGLDLLREGNYNAALPLLESCLDDMNTPEANGTILFWIGVTLGQLGEDKRALRAYNDVVIRFPKSTRAPSSLLRQAKLFEILGDTTTAKIMYKKLKTDYPNARETKMIGEE